MVFFKGSDKRAFAAVQLGAERFYYIDNENNESAWPGIVYFIMYINNSTHDCCSFVSKHTAGIPQDGSPVDVVLGISLFVAGVIYTLSFAVICFTLICLGFNIIFRKRK